VDQISLNFQRVVDFLDSTGISTVHYLRVAETEAQASAPDARFPRTEIGSISVEELKKLDFWQVA
jgi:histidinol-phosphatase (PHP family)